MIYTCGVLYKRAHETRTNRVCEFEPKQLPMTCFRVRYYSTSWNPHSSDCQKNGGVTIYVLKYNCFCWSTHGSDCNKKKGLLKNTFTYCFEILLFFFEVGPRLHPRPHPPSNPPTGVILTAVGMRDPHCGARRGGDPQWVWGVWGLGYPHCFYCPPGITQVCLKEYISVCPS